MKNRTNVRWLTQLALLVAILLVLNYTPLGYLQIGPLSASLLDKHDQILDKRLAKDVKIIDGVKGVLAGLKLPHGICSNSTSERLAMMLGKVGIKDHFGKHIYSARDLGPDRVKPKPDIFLHGAKQFDADPAHTLVIEDSVHGIAGAKAAGLRAIWFNPQGKDWQGEAAPDAQIRRLAELPALLAGWTAGR